VRYLIGETSVLLYGVSGAPSNAEAR